MSDVQQKRETLSGIKHLLSINDKIIPEGYSLSPAKLMFVQAWIREDAIEMFLQGCKAAGLAIEHDSRRLKYPAWDTPPFSVVYYGVRVESPPIDFVENLANDDICYSFSAHVQDGLIRFPGDIIANFLTNRSDNQPGNAHSEVPDDLEER